VDIIEAAREVAEAVGYPLMIKAAAGGGGRGIRHSGLQGGAGAGVFLWPAGKPSWRFGDKRVYIESYLPGARHIEVQILADEYGNTIHLGTRECTMQRKKPEACGGSARSQRR
jgi:acetyl-CoA carboxylase biotin carboxylase subunit